MTLANRIKLAVTIGGFGVAGVVFALETRQSRPVAEEGLNAVDLLCTKCNTHFRVTFEEFARASTVPSPRSGGTSAGVGRGRSNNERSVDFACPSCGQRTGKPASHCSKHGVYYLKFTKKGLNARCPQCTSGSGVAS